jgi:hypothetical protein
VKQCHFLFFCYNLFLKRTTLINVFLPVYHGNLLKITYVLHVCWTRYRYVWSVMDLCMKRIVYPKKFHEGLERSSSTLPLTSVLNRVDGQRHASPALPPVKSRFLYQLYRRMGGLQGRSYGCGVSPATVIRSLDGSARRSRDIEWAVPVTYVCICPFVYEFCVTYEPKILRPYTRKFYICTWWDTCR